MSRHSFFDLGFAWKGAANTHCLPWLAVENLRSFHEGLMRERDPDVNSFLKAGISRVREDLGHDFSLDIAERVAQSLKNALMDVQSNRRRVIESFDKEDAWRQFLAIPEFQLMVLASQRLAFAGVYYAYEDWLLRCFMLRKGIARYRIRDKDFGRDLNEVFGDWVSERCWRDDRIRIARKVRHAIVHTGGRLTDALRSEKHHLTVVDEELQIMAPNTRALFDCLKGAAEVLAQACVPKD